MDRRGVEVGKRRVIGAELTTGKRLQGRRNLLSNSQVLRPAASDCRAQTLVDVLHGKLAQPLFREFLVEFARQHGRARHRTERGRMLAADFRIHVQQFPVAVPVDDVQSPDVLIVGIVGHKEMIA